MTEPVHQYLLFYKPYDVVTQFSPVEAAPGPAPETAAKTLKAKTLKDYIPVPDVYPVGRLDRDSEGLLLLTSDGPLQHQLTDPRYGHPRTYWVQVERVPDAGALEALRRGVEIRGYQTRPAEVCLIPEPTLPPRDPPIRVRQQIPTAWLAMTLREGKNRQVRRMTAAVGFPTLRLVRVAIAHLQLQNLQPGDWRALSPEEIQQLKALARPSLPLRKGARDRFPRR